MNAGCCETRYFEDQDWGQILKGSFLTFMKEHGFGVPTDKTTPTVIYTAVFFTKQCLFVDVVRKYSF